MPPKITPAPNVPFVKSPPADAWPDDPPGGKLTPPQREPVDTVPLNQRSVMHVSPFDPQPVLNPAPPRDADSESQLSELSETPPPAEPVTRQQDDPAASRLRVASKAGLICLSLAGAAVTLAGHYTGDGDMVEGGAWMGGIGLSLLAAHRFGGRIGHALARCFGAGAQADQPDAV